MADLIYQEREPLDGHGIKGLPNIDGLTLEGVEKLIEFLVVSRYRLAELAVDAKDLGYDDVDARLWVNVEKAAVSVSAKRVINAAEAERVQLALLPDHDFGDPDGVKGTSGKTVLVHKTDIDLTGVADAHVDDEPTCGTGCPVCEKAEVDFSLAARRLERLAEKEQHDDDR